MVGPEGGTGFIGAAAEEVDGVVEGFNSVDCEDGGVGFEAQEGWAAGGEFEDDGVGVLGDGVEVGVCFLEGFEGGD